MKRYIGIDNGVTGTMALVDEGGSVTGWQRTPTKSELDYHSSTVRWIRRIDTVRMESTLRSWLPNPDFALAVMEQPAVDRIHFTTSISAARSFEATLIVLESIGVPYIVVSSKKWQRTMLPKGVKGRADLKAAANEVARKLAPSFTESHKDGDALVMAVWAYREGL